jgi:hypothetical protein
LSEIFLFTCRRYIFAYYHITNYVLCFSWIYSIYGSYFYWFIVCAIMWWLILFPILMSGIPYLFYHVETIHCKHDSEVLYPLPSTLPMHTYLFSYIVMLADYLFWKSSSFASGKHIMFCPIPQSLYTLLTWPNGTVSKFSVLYW